MTEIEKRIQEARPHISVVSPLAAAIILGYATISTYADSTSRAYIRAFLG